MYALVYGLSAWPHHSCSCWPHLLWILFPGFIPNLMLLPHAAALFTTPPPSSVLPLYPLAARKAIATSVVGVLREQHDGNWKKGNVIEDEKGLR